MTKEQIKKIYNRNYYKKNRSKWKKIYWKRCWLKRKDDKKYIKKRREWFEKNKNELNLSRLKSRFELLKKFKFTCQYCGEKAPKITLQIDHIIPRSKGGKNTLNNLTVSCIKCNVGKSNLII